MSFFDELKRRNVFRVGVAYVVASWVILQVADLVFEAIKAPDWVLQAMMALVVLGFLASLIIAWAYEVTPEGIKRESEVDRSQSVTTETASKLNHITIGLLIAVAALVIVDRFVLERAPRAPEDPVAISGTPETKTGTDSPVAKPIDETDDSKSVAVLPFVNMSSDPEQEFFSDGISEEILNVLTRIPNLKVAARTSSFQFKGQNLDIADIGKQLRVNHVLEGSVRKAGSQLRITAQLIEAQTGYHLWSDTYDRQLEDVFAIQDEIANAIAGELRTRLADQPLASARQVDMQAYELYLKSRSLVASRKAEALYEAIDLLQNAIKLAPDYAPAMATLAQAYMVIPWFSRIDPVGELREHARVWAQRALEIDPGNPEALAALAVVYNESDMNPSAALELMQRAVDNNPGSVAANNFMGDLALRTGDLETALVYESRAAELDPLGAVQLTDLANVYLVMNDYEKTRELAERALELSPEFGHAQRHMIDYWLSTGDAVAMRTELERQMALYGHSSAGHRNIQFYVHLIEGDHDLARAILDDAVSRARAGKAPTTMMAFEAVYLGDFDTAGELLMLALEQNDGTWTYPSLVRLPEQAPDSEPWQRFWAQPGPARLAALRRANGLDPNIPLLKQGTIK